MELEYFFVLLLILLVQRVAAQSWNDSAFPSFPTIFSFYREDIVNYGELPATARLSRSLYEAEWNITRIDVAGESIGLGNGSVSLIQDASFGMMYTIYRQHSNCTVSPLVPESDLYIDQNLMGHFNNLNDMLLLSGVNFTYAGNMSAHGLILDNWIYNGNLSYAGYNYTNSTVQWSITRSGQNISSITSTAASPLPWRFSIEGQVTSSYFNKTYLSSVSRFFDLSFDEPNSDIFDVSICVDPREAVFLTLAVPGMRSGVDPGRFKGNVRKSVSNYTQLHLIQVGNVEITKENGTFMFVSLQLSNLTDVANMTNHTSAQEAYNNIMDNTIEGEAPFHIELSPGITVTPYIIDPYTCQCPSSAYVSATQSISSELFTTPSPSVIIITTTITVTATPTVTCPSIPTPLPTTPPTCQVPSAGVSQSHVVGIAFGTLITGSFISCVSLTVCFVCYQKTRTRKWSPSTVGYQKTPDSVTERDYFQ